MSSLRPRRLLIDISSATIFRIFLIIFGFAFLYFIRDVVLILFVAMILTAAMDPFADFLEKHRLPRWIAVVIVYGLLLSFVALIIALVIPPVVEQANQLSEEFPSFVTQVTDKYAAFQDLSSRYHLGERFSKAFDTFGSGLGSFTTEGQGNSLFSQTLDIFGGVASFFIILVISFYFTVNEGGIKRFLRVTIPSRHQNYAIDLLDRIQYKLAKWVQGQLFLAVLMGIIVGSTLAIMGVPYAMIFGLIAGAMEFVPVIGPVIASIPAIIIAFFVSPFLGVATIVFFIVIQQITNHILVPKIMQKAVGLHPVIVIIAMLIGARVLGVFGLLLAVPVATIIAVFVNDFLDDTEETPSSLKEGAQKEHEEDTKTSPIISK